MGSQMRNLIPVAALLYWAKASPLGKSAKTGPPSGSMGMPDDVEEEVVEKKAKHKTNTKNNKHPDKEPKQGNNT